LSFSLVRRKNRAAAAPGPFSLVSFNTRDKGHETYLAFTRLNGREALSSCPFEGVERLPGSRTAAGAELRQRSSNSIAASRVGTCSLRRIADT